MQREAADREELREARAFIDGHDYLAKHLRKGLQCRLELQEVEEHEEELPEDEEHAYHRDEEAGDGELGGQKRT